eukprot:6179463-Pleurochrysis_carterae.AAC.2
MPSITAEGEAAAFSKKSSTVGQTVSSASYEKVRVGADRAHQQHPERGRLADEGYRAHVTAAMMPSEPKLARFGPAAAATHGGGRGGAGRGGRRYGGPRPTAEACAPGQV